MKADCANCTSHACYTKGVNCTEYKDEDILSAYSDEEKKIMQAAAYVEGTFYSNITRLEETAEFAKAMNYKRLGMAFCIGFNAEAKYIARFFKNRGFEFYSVCCKNCSFAKKNLDLKQVKPELEHEAMCNPKFQAKILAEKNTELFIACGLCVGHDAIFNASCPGPVTTLVVKDRLLAHNPLGAIYSRYWKRKLGIMDEGEI
ncbi:MAG: DUF1847 domain-containing protein [Anaerovibrio sp.]|uniref:DUF1847 domain-containing protein n=1 Tax=Anaerovibrio sp. TaxID=1872532 RepID=UPI0025D8126A|nr:DUF1847 domain-containing protein [Anaerovibrio sp.]MCR5176933.1 DUF1847 domain-containing protein [Anaerovibrio sp.]